MKKIKALFLVLLSSLFCLTGCVEKKINFEGEYWNSNPSTFSKIVEELVYDVKVVNVTPSNSKELKNEYVTFEITDGTYTTKLEGFPADTNYYKYVTTLNVKGFYKYYIDEKPIEVNNFLQTEVIFESRANGFKPISSKRTTYNSETGQDNGTTIFFYYNGGFLEHKFKYNYTIDYDGDDAITNSVYTYFSDEELVNEFNKTYKDYSDGAYIDNNMLTLLPRAFTLTDGFYQTFKTIDVPSNANREMIFAVSDSEDTVSQYTFTVDYNYILNGAKVDFNSSIVTAKLLTGINDTFAGANIESYYAVDKTTHRHRMIKSYSTLNDDIGYIEYSLKSASVTE